jgi:hypothetical protein
VQQTADRVPLFPTERAFVVQFRAEATVEQGCYEGRIEHVVSGQARRFHTLEELLAFMVQVLTALHTAPEETP